MNQITTPYPSRTDHRQLMKPAKLHLLALLGAALLAALPSATHGQANNNPPTQLTYQGFLTDPNGAPLGNASPVNKTIQFRIFAAESGGTALWASSQVVTVDKGHFSVLLGQGSAVGSEPFSADLTSHFTGPGASDRFVELTVDGAALAPRLRFLPAPYAMLARKAMTVDSTATLVATQIPNLDASKILTGTLDVARIPNLDFSKIATGNIPNARTTATSANTANAIVARNESGNINVGKAFADQLDFGSSVGAKISLWGGFSTSGYFGLDIDHSLLRFRVNNFVSDFSFQAGATELMRIKGNGNVGVGTTTPRAPLHVVKAGYSWADTLNTDHKTGKDDDFGFYLGKDAAGGGVGGYVNTAGDDCTIAYKTIAAIFEGMTIAKDRVYVGNFSTSSDLRAKNVLGLSKPEEDLATVLKLRVTDYQWIDRTKDGHRKHKQLIAQDVERVFPQAVTVIPMLTPIPNVYEVAAALEHDVQAKSLKVTTKKAHDFKAGDQVDLMMDASPMTTVEVKAVVTPNQFVVAAEKPAKTMFVYGKQVKDFRSVDYTAISMLNVSATQELARQNEALKKRVSELESRERQVVALQKRVDELEGLERQVADLQKLVRQVAERQNPSPRAAASENGPASVLPVSAR